MQNNILETKMNLIKKIEKQNNSRNLDTQIIQQLWYLVKNDYDTYTIREKYKQILIELNKYTNNYYSFICIALNVMKNKKEHLGKNTPINSREDLQYITQKIAGEITTNIKNVKSTVKYIRKKVYYIELNYTEGVYKKNNNTIKNELIQNATVLLNHDKLSLENAKIWVKQYEEFIIKNYGRWSKEYEQYMNTTFEIPFILTSPNILLLAMRETMKKGIKSALNNMCANKNNN